MNLLISELDDDQIYKLLISSVVPRPIAWISTLSPDGTVNLAPFSAFTFVSCKPPMLAVSISERDGAYKDTTRNILACEEFVINIANFALAHAVQASSKPFAHGVSEVEHLGLQTTPSRLIATPGIAAAPLSLECRLRHCIEFGNDRDKLMVGEVVALRAKDDLIENGKIDSSVLDPLARVAGPNFARLGRIVPATSLKTGGASQPALHQQATGLDRDRAR